MVSDFDEDFAGLAEPPPGETAAQRDARRLRLMAAFATSRDPLRRLAAEVFAYARAWGDASATPAQRDAVAAAVLSLERDVPAAMAESFADWGYREEVARLAAGFAEEARRYLAWRRAGGSW